MVRNKLVVSGIAVAALATLGLGAGVAAASTHHAKAATAQTERLQLVSTDPNGTTSNVLLVGAFNAAGSDRQLNDNLDRVTTGNGTFEIHHPSANQTETDHFYRSSCTFVARFAGHYTVSNGTGRYAGITGHGSYHGVFSGRSPRNSNGKCSNSEQILDASELINARGPVTLP